MTDNDKGAYAAGRSEHLAIHCIRAGACDASLRSAECASYGCDHCGTPVGHGGDDRRVESFWSM